MIGGERFCGNVEKSEVFSDFSKYCGKVWENPYVFGGFFHAFPQYVISMKQSGIPTDYFIDPFCLLTRATVCGQYTLDEK